MSGVSPKLSEPMLKSGMLCVLSTSLILLKQSAPLVKKRKSFIGSRVEAPISRILDRISMVPRLDWSVIPRPPAARGAVAKVVRAFARSVGQPIIYFSGSMTT